MDDAFISGFKCHWIKDEVYFFTDGGTKIKESSTPYSCDWVFPLHIKITAQSFYHSECWITDSRPRKSSLGNVLCGYVRVIYKVCALRQVSSECGGLNLCMNKTHLCWQTSLCCILLQSPGERQSAHIHRRAANRRHVSHVRSSAV